MNTFVLKLLNLFILYFIYFIYDLEDKNLLEYSNLFSSNEYEKNDKIILKYFQ